MLIKRFRGHVTSDPGKRPLIVPILQAPRYIVADLGTSRHTTSSQRLINNFEATDSPISRMANDGRVQVKMVGIFDLLFFLDLTVNL